MEAGTPRPRLQPSVFLGVLAGGSDRVPLAAEVVQTFALRLAGFGVERESIERMAGIGDLHASVASPGRGEERRLYAGTCDRLPMGEKGRPIRRARPRAHALVAPVLCEEVKGASVCVDQDFPKG